MQMRLAESLFSLGGSFGGCLLGVWEGSASFFLAVRVQPNIVHVMCRSHIIVRMDFLLFLFCFSCNFDCSAHEQEVIKFPQDIVSLAFYANTLDVVNPALLVATLDGRMWDIDIRAVENFLGKQMYDVCMILPAALPAH